MKITYVTLFLPRSALYPLTIGAAPTLRMFRLGSPPIPPAPPDLPEASEWLEALALLEDELRMLGSK